MKTIEHDLSFFQFVYSYIQIIINDHIITTLSCIYCFTPSSDKYTDISETCIYLPAMLLFKQFNTIHYMDLQTTNRHLIVGRFIFSRWELSLLHAGSFHYLTFIDLVIIGVVVKDQFTHPSVAGMQDSPRHAKGSKT